MPPITITTVLQTVVALGLLNVWLVRARSSTSYRGGASQTLREEFRAYGLPDWVFYVVGFLKVAAAILLLVGLWRPELVRPAAAVVVILMLGALAMHGKVKDPPLKSLPAFLVLAMSGALVVLS